MPTRQGNVHVPLAERMRPGTIEELCGQDEAQAFLNDIASKPVRSVILWGPPGSGKTTVARLLGIRLGSRFEVLSAVDAGLPALRRIVDVSRAACEAGLEASVLFLDEIHRWNRVQQDALLPAVESGDLTLVGATTENPSYSLAGALLSRCRVVRLDALEPEHLHALLLRAAADPLRGLNRPDLAVSEVATPLARASQGDARAALGMLEWLAMRHPVSDGPPGPEVLAAATAGRSRAHDRSGDDRHTLISVLHKAVRGSDPQAAVYWTRRLLVDGEDPLYVARRLVRMASEDVGLADPGALRAALDAHDAIERLGMPEGGLALLQAAIHLSLAPRSDSVFQAEKAVDRELSSSRRPAVPTEFINAVTAFDRARGVGHGYLHDHNTPHGYSGQDHLPEELRGTVFWAPVDRGRERDLARRLAWFEQHRRMGSADASDFSQAQANPGDPA